mgnify:CR=1 FL=1
MSVFLKRGKWWGRKENGQTQRFKTEAEAYEFTGEKPPKPEKPKKVAKPTLGVKNAPKKEIKQETVNQEISSEETTSTYKTTPLRFSKGYGKKKV